MKAIDIPDRFPKYWALDADPGDVNDIPENSTGVPGRASLDVGFPHETMVPIGAGGVPPFGQDANGIFRQLTRNIQWSANAGTAFPYDSVFSTAIGGYPKGAVVQAASAPGWFWISFVDDNTSDPDAAGAGWSGFTPTKLFGGDVGTKNAGSIAFHPPPPNQNFLLGMAIHVEKMATANDAGYTLNVGFGNTPVIHPDGTAIGAGELPGSSIFTVVLDLSGNFQIQNVTNSAARKRLSANTTFFLSTTGSDANNGTAIGTPWLTFQHAWNVLTQQYDLNGFNATVQVADGTFTSGCVCDGPTTVGGGEIIFVSASGNPSACAIAAAAGNGFLVTNYAQVTVRNIGIAAAAGSGFFVASKGTLEFQGVKFGACLNYHIFADEQGRVTIADAYSISGNAVCHWNAQSQGEIHIGTNPFTITLIGTPAFSGQFARASNLGLIVLNASPTFSGGATGQRYSATFNAVINTGSGSTTYLPGNSAGSVATGGQYN